MCQGFHVGSEGDDLHLNGEWQGWAWVHSATPGEVEQPLPAHLE